MTTLVIKICAFPKSTRLVLPVSDKMMIIFITAFAVLFLLSAGVQIRGASGFLVSSHTRRPNLISFRPHKKLSSVSSTIVNVSSTRKSPVVSNDETATLGEVEQFQWFKSWYPLVPVEYLDPEKPHKFELLGMDLVVWNDGKLSDDFQSKRLIKNRKRSEGQWRVFMDECPHRKVPLSEGRVESDGSLLCSYHAWRFDGKGTLLDIPQLSSQSTIERIASNPKSKCNSFPTQVVDGVLWVWAETGKDSTLEALVTPVPHYKLLEGVDLDRAWFGPWNSRELPYGHDYFIENVVDPAHVAVSHHNVVGSRYGDQRLKVEMVRPVSKSGFAMQPSSMAEGAVPSTVTFTAPSTVAIETSFGTEGAFQVLELYSSPSRPGFCNHVGRMVVVKDRSGKMPGLLRTFSIPMPKWFNHILSSFFLNQDALFLHHQERHLAKTGQYTTLLSGEEEQPEAGPYLYGRATLPIAVDRGVLAFRDWMRNRAGGRIPYRHNPAMPPPDREAVFDVWNQHTKHCRICQRALRNLKLLRFGAFAAAACVGVVRPLRPTASLAAVLVSAALGLLVNRVIGMFYRYEYSHAHND